MGVADVGALRSDGVWRERGGEGLYDIDEIVDILHI